MYFLKWLVWGRFRVKLYQISYCSQCCFWSFQRDCEDFYENQGLGNAYDTGTQGTSSRADIRWLKLTCMYGSLKPYLDQCECVSHWKKLHTGSKYCFLIFLHCIKSSDQYCSKLWASKPKVLHPGGELKNHLTHT